MDIDASPKASQPMGRLISNLNEFELACWHTGWTLLEHGNPGLAFAAALFLPWNTDGYHALFRDFDQGLNYSHSELLGKTGLPGGAETLRILERFDRSWWHSFENAEEARAAMHVLFSLLKFEPEAARFFSRYSRLTPEAVVELASGMDFDLWVSSGMNSWVFSVLFRSEHVQKAEWFFRLPFVRRCWLARMFWEIHGRHVGDFVTEAVELGGVPRKPHLDAFRDESHAVAYSIHLRRRRKRIRRLCFEEARFRPWPEHIIPGSGTIVPIRNLGQAYPESREMEFMPVDPKETLDIPLGRICLYRMLRPFPALVVLEYPHERCAPRERMLHPLIVRRNESQTRIQSAEDQVERWLARQPEELRQRPVVSKFAKEIMESARYM